jgi:hypothetical protein
MFSGSAAFVKKLCPGTLAKLRDANKFDYQLYRTALELHDEFLAGWREIQSLNGSAPDAGAAARHAPDGAGRAGVRAHKRNASGLKALPQAGAAQAKSRRERMQATGR